MLQSHYFRITAFFIAIVVLSACHSRKLTVRNNPNTDNSGQYVLVKPDKKTADKYAEIMGINRSDIQNGRLYSFIDDWYGTPYRLGGMDKGGVDCSGFVSLLQQQVYNQSVPRTCAMQANAVKRKYEEELKEGDLVFFDFDGKQFSHVGVYLQNGYIVHASTRKGIMVVRLRDNSMYKYFSRAGSVVDRTSSAQNN